MGAGNINLRGDIYAAAHQVLYLLYDFSNIFITNYNSVDSQTRQYQAKYYKSN
jgi:hypothetical protein